MAFRTHPPAQNLHNDNLPAQMNLLLEGLGVGEEEFRTWTKKNWKQKVHLSHWPPNQIPQLDLYSPKPQLLISNRVLAEEKWLSSNKRDCVEYPFWIYTSHSYPLVFETFLKCGKLQCTSTFNRKWVCLLMIEHIETNQIVIYLPGDI